jgi:hypothetical protein
MTDELNTLKSSIDRFEGEIAVCESPAGTSMTIEKSKLPAEAKAGDVLCIDGDTITIDTEETAARKKKVAALVDELFQ